MTKPPSIYRRQRDAIRTPDLIWRERWAMPGHSLVHRVHYDLVSGKRTTACGAHILADYDTQLPNDTYMSCSACDRGWWARLYAEGYDMWDIAALADRHYADIHQGLQLAGAMTPNRTKAWYTP